MLRKFYFKCGFTPIMMPSVAYKIRFDRFSAKLKFLEAKFGKKNLVLNVVVSIY